MRTTLSNGLRVVLVRNTLAPVVSVITNYLVGSNEAPPGLPGLAHAQEHMMFRGSRELSGDQLAEIIANIGGDFNAETQQDVTQYSFTVPVQDLGVALHIESIRMRSVLDSDTLWNQERGALEQEVAQDISNPEYVVYKQLLAATFPQTPLAQDPLGTRESFERITGKTLKRFHQAWYAPNNAILVIAGDINFQQTLSEIQKLFGSMPARPLPERPPFRLPPVRAGTLHLTTDLPYGLAIVAFRMPGFSSPDFPAAQVLADVLSSERGSLYSLVPQGKALFADFELSLFRRSGLGYAQAGFPKGGNGEALVHELRRIVMHEARAGIPADLVEAAKEDELTSVELEKNSIPDLASAWSQAVAVEGRSSPEEDLNALRRVSAEALNRAARKYLTLDRGVSAVLTPHPAGKPISSRPFKTTESFAPAQVKPVKLPRWAADAIRGLPLPRSGVHPAVSTLPNGIRLILQPEPVSDAVSLYGEIRSNPELEEPQGQEGIDDVLDQLFAYGTKTLDRLRFEEALDEIGAVEAAGTDFSLQVLASHFDRGVELLASNELHPRLPESALRIIRRQSAATVAGQLQSPDHLADRACNAALFPANDPALRQATPASIFALTLPAVKSYYQRVFRPDLTTIVVIGNVTVQQARRTLQRYFGEWKAYGPKPETVLRPVPPNKASMAAIPDASRVQDSVTLAETLGLRRSDKDYYALMLGNRILSGGFYASRLYRDLREQTGLVYFVEADLDVGRTRATYEVDYGCDPRNVSKARAIVIRDIKALQMTPVSPSELHEAKAMLLREIPLSESSVDSIAGGWLERSDLSMPLDEPELAARRYMDLTADEVRAAFARWLRPEHFVEVTEGPKPE